MPSPEAPGPVRVVPYGDAAFLVELASSAAVAAYTRALRDAPPVGVVEVVPAARTVLVRHDLGSASSDTLRRALVALDHATSHAVQPTGSTPVEIAVRYDGEDLAAVARLCGITIDEVVQRHQASTYLSAFCGFAPGFAYLTGLDVGLTVPRLDSPRPRVAAGSVAIAGEFSGIYPNDMPGGWRILGHTSAVLWDLTRAEPALLPPGTSVRFRSVDR